MKDEIFKKIKKLEDRLEEVTREKGLAASEGGGWHDNPAFDSLAEEEAILKERLQNLREILNESDSP